MREIFGETYYSLREAAKAAGCSPARLYTLRRAGVLHAIPIQADNARWEYYTTPAAVLEALATPLPKATPRPTHSLSFKERDAAARVLLREKFGMRV